MANFNYLDFFKTPSGNDTKLFIKDINNNVVWTLSPFKIKSSIIQNNNIRINFTNGDFVLLDFNTVYESKIALTKLQDAIVTLINKVPNNIDKDIELYIHNVSSFDSDVTFNGNILSGSSSYSIGSNNLPWNNIYSNNITLTSTEGNITLSTDGELLLINGTPSFSPSFTTLNASGDAKLLSSTSFRFNPGASSYTSVSSFEGFDNSQGFYLKGILPVYDDVDGVIFGVFGENQNNYFVYISNTVEPTYTLGYNFPDVTELYVATYSEALNFSLYSDGNLIHYNINGSNIASTTYSTDKYYFYAVPLSSGLGNTQSFNDVLFYPTGKRGWADKYYCTSNSFITIPPVYGAVVLQTQPNLAWTNGQWARIANQADNFYTVGNYFYDDTAAIKFLAEIDSYNAETGELIVVCQKSDTIGSTASFWYINLTGESGSGTVVSYFNSASFSRISTTHSLIMQNSRIYMNGGWSLRFTNYAEEITNFTRQLIRAWDKPGPINFDNNSSNVDYERAQISFDLETPDASSISLHSFNWTNYPSSLDYELKFYNGEISTFITTDYDVKTATGSVINNTTLKGTTEFQQTIEVFNSSTASTSITYDFNLGSIWYHNDLSSDFEADFINIPETANRIISTTIVIIQGGSAYIPNSVTINGGSSLPIYWANGSLPTGTPNQIDLIGFSFIITNSGISVLGQLSTYNTV